MASIKYKLIILKGPLQSSIQNSSLSSGSLEVLQNQYTIKVDQSIDLLNTIVNINDIVYTYKYEGGTFVSTNTAAPKIIYDQIFNKFSINTSIWTNLAKPKITITENVKSKYRCQQPLLFQRAHTKTITLEYTNSKNELVKVPNAIVNLNGLGGLNIPAAGANRTKLCPLSGWFWKNPNVGDWVDSLGTSQGTSAFSKSISIPGLSKNGSVQIDVTTAVNSVFRKKWLAFYLKYIGNGAINIVAPLNKLKTGSTLELTYIDGTSESCSMWFAASLRSSTDTTNAMDEIVEVYERVPLLLEFFQPNSTLKIKSAILNLVYDSVPTSSGGLFEVYLVDPQLPDFSNVEKGIAQDYLLDKDLSSNPDILLSVVIKNTGTKDDYIVSASDYVAESSFDPSLWDKDKILPKDELDALYPNKHFGKLVGTTRGLVNIITEANEEKGFKPLAEGLGAYEFFMPGRNIKSGQCWFASGESASDTRFFLPRDRIGQLTNGYLRYYIRLGKGWEAKDDDFRIHFTASPEYVGKYPEEFGTDPNSLPYRSTDLTGKFPGGLQQPTYRSKWKHYTPPTREGSYATSIVNVDGNYGVTSGLAGYQGRHSFSQGLWKEDLPGPVVGGASISLEAYDFADYIHSIPSQRVISNWDSTGHTWFGHKGGMAHMYPFNWYCLEVNWQLNSVTEYQLPPVGTDYREGGYLVDGQVTAWVDGIKCSQTPKFATRSGLMIDWAIQNMGGAPLGYNSNSRRAITNVPLNNYLGFSEVIMNPYYGGRSPNPRDKYIFIGGIAVSSKYIGPMRGVSVNNGGLG